MAQERRADAMPTDGTEPTADPPAPPLLVSTTREGQCTLRSEHDMPFTVEDFHDLVQLLEERPQWRAEMRRLVMSDEYLAVPEQIAELQRQTAELQRQTGDLQRQTAELQRQTGELQRQTAELRRETAELGRRLEQVRLEVAELRRDMERRFNDVDEKIDRLQGDVGQLKDDVGQLRGDVAQLKGNDLERRYREHAHAFFGNLVRKCRVVGSQELSEIVDDAIDRGVLSESDRKNLMLADLVVRGRWRTDGRTVMLLAEISWTVDLSDVSRATDRAALLAKLGTPVVPVVAGASVTERAADMARSHEVWQMLNGRIIEPPADAPANPDGVRRRRSSQDDYSQSQGEETT